MTFESVTEFEEFFNTKTTITTSKNSAISESVVVQECNWSGVAKWSK